MSDLFGNHIVGFPTRRLIYFQRIGFNLGPVVEPVYEVQKICRKSDSNTRARFKLGAYTGVYNTKCHSVHRYLSYEPLSLEKF